MRYSCCIEMLYTELPVEERVAAAKQDGFEYIEFWTWENKDIDALEKALKDNDMKVSIFQGNTVGRMVDPAETDLYIEGVKRTLPVAKQLGCETLFLMSDVLQEDRSVLPPDHPISAEEKRNAAITVLRRLAEIGKEWGITFVIEPLNTLVDHKGYSLSASRDAFEIVREVNHPNVRVLYDAYHMQIMEGNIIETIREGWPLFGHFHIADVPGRCQPGTGEMNYKNILRALAETGYDGPVGFEFSPANGTSKEVLRQVFATI